MNLIAPESRKQAIYLKMYFTD